MTTPTLHFPLRSDFVGRTRTGTISASPTGPQRFINNAYYAEEATTNLITNPSAETSTTGWGFGAAGTTITRITSDAYVGSACLEIGGDGVNAPVASHAISGAAVNGDSFSIQARIKGEAGKSVRLRLRIVDGSSVTIRYVEGTTVVCDGTWQLHTLSHTIADAAAATVQFYVQSITVAHTFKVDAAQAEKKAYATTYADGSLGTGYSWAGTAHASTSTRAESQLTFNPTGLINLTEGEMHVRVAYGNSAVAAQYAFLHLNGTNSRLYLLRLPATDKIGVGLGSSGNGANEPGTTPDGTSIVQGMSWLNNAAISYKNGVQSATTTPASGLTAITATAYIGGNPANLANGPVSDLMIFDRRLTDSERARLMAQPQWSFDVLKKKVYRGLTLPV